VGVTKAAIYYQFNTKDAILIGVLDVKLSPLEGALNEAEAAGATLAAREALLASVIDTVVQNRHALGTLQGDPVLVRYLREHEPSRQMWARLFTVLIGGELDAKARTRAAVLSAAIGAASHPFVADMDDDTLRVQLLDVTRRLIFRPG
jgi:AcrR family transcriptional regulator